MEFFEKVFNWIEQLSAQVGSFDVKAYFFIVLGVIILVGIIVGFTFFDSTRYKLLRASKRIINYLKTVDNVDDDNVAEFTERCFSDSVPKSLKNAWVEFLGVRFGYPSEIISQSNVYDREVKKADNIRQYIFLTIGLILVGLFAFFGYGALEKTAMSVIWLLGLLVVALIYIILVMIAKSLNKKSLNAFNEMQEDIDAKVNLPIETNYSTDGSPLNEAASIIDEIIAKNVSRDINAGYEEVNVDMGQPVEMHPVEKNYKLRQEPVYVQKEFNDVKIVPSVPRIKKKLFKKVQVEEPQVVKEETPVEEPKKEEKKLIKKTKKKAKEKVVEVKPQEEVKVEQPLVQEPVPQEEVKVESIPVSSKSEFDFAGDAFVPVSLEPQAEEVQTPEVKEEVTPVEETPVEETPVTETAPEAVEAPVEEAPIEETKETVEEAKNDATVNSEEVVEEVVQPQVEETPVVEDVTEEIQEEYVQPELKMVTNIEDDEDEDVDTPTLALDGSLGFNDMMSTSAFGSSILPPKSKEEFEAEKAKKKTKKKKSK